MRNRVNGWVVIALFVGTIILGLSLPLVNPLGLWDHIHAEAEVVHATEVAEEVSTEIPCEQLELQELFVSPLGNTDVEYNLVLRDDGSYYFDDNCGEHASGADEFLSELIPAFPDYTLSSGDRCRSLERLNTFVEQEAEGEYPYLTVEEFPFDVWGGFAPQRATIHLSDWAEVYYKTFTVEDTECYRPEGIAISDEVGLGIFDAPSVRVCMREDLFQNNIAPADYGYEEWTNSLGETFQVYTLDHNYRTSSDLFLHTFYVRRPGEQPETCMDGEDVGAIYSMNTDRINGSLVPVPTQTP